MVGTNPSLRRLLVAATLLTVTATLASCGSTTQGPQVVRSAGGPASTSLAWQPCEDSPGEECASFEVPKSWSDATVGGTFRLHVRKLPAQPRQAGQAPQGSLVVNFGGPGIPSAAGQLQERFDGIADLRAAFDLVMMDPRGTGRSEPKLTPCPQDPMLDRQQPTAGAFSWPQVTSFRLGQQSPLGAECLRLNATDGRLVGTGEVVGDLEALRKALGDEQLSYLGYSYGTRLGTQYARTFPDRVRAMVLDGTVDPSGTIMGLGSTLSAGDPRTADFIRASLAPDFVPVYDEVERYLRTAAIDDKGFVTTRWTFGYDIAGLGAGETTATGTKRIQQLVCELARAAGLPTGPCPEPEPEPPQGIDGATASNTPSDSLSDVLNLPPTSELYSFTPAKALINCADLSGRPDADAVAALMPPPDGANTLLTASMLLMYVPLCAGYPDAWSPIGAMTTVSDGPTPLFVNGTADPATPIVGARAMQASFPGSRMVSLATAQHGIFPAAGSNCVNDTVLTYLVTQVAPATDVICPAAGD